jgi:inner membrane protein
MALTLTHAAAGYLLYELEPRAPHRWEWGRALAYMGLANAADLDFLPGLLVNQPGLWHRAASHSVAAVVVVATVIALAVRGLGRGSARRAFVMGAVLYASHLLLDFLTADARPPHGGPFLWPLTDRFFLSPITVFGEIIIDPRSSPGFVRSLLTPTALAVWRTEVLVFVTTVAVVRGWRLFAADEGALPTSEDSQAESA